MGATSSAELARMEAEDDAYARAHVTDAQALVDAFPSSQVSDAEKAYIMARLERDSWLVHTIIKNPGSRYVAIKIHTEGIDPAAPLAKHHYTGAVRSTPNDKTTGDEAVSLEAAAAAAPAASVSAAAAPSHPQPPPPPLGAEPKPAADSSSRASAATSGGAVDEDEHEEDSNDEHVPLLTKKTQ